MIILQIFIGLFAAVGIGCILADLMKVPTMKASKAANNLGKKGDNLSFPESHYFGDAPVQICRYY